MRPYLLILVVAMLAACSPSPTMTTDASGNVVAVPQPQAGHSNLLAAGAGAVAGYMMGKSSNPAQAYGGYHAPAPAPRTVIVNKTIVQKNVTIVRPRAAPSPSWRSSSSRSISRRR